MDKKSINLPERSNIVKEVARVPEIFNRQVNMFDLFVSGRYVFMVGWLRYGGGGRNKSWIAAAVCRDDSEIFIEKFDDLDAGDDDALRSFDYIKDHADYYAVGETPSQALKAVEDQIAEFRATL